MKSDRKNQCRRNQMVSGSKDLKDLNLKKMDKLGIGKLTRGYSRFNVFIGGLVSVFMCLPFVSCGISVYNRGETNAVENGEDMVDSRRHEF